MIGGLDDIPVFDEAKTSKDIVKFLGVELADAPALCCIGGISWVDVWTSVHVLVDVLKKYPLGERTFLILCLGCGC